MLKRIQNAKEPAKDAGNANKESMCCFLVAVPRWEASKALTAIDIY
jgi:hypothetical protein